MQDDVAEVIEFLKINGTIDSSMRPCGEKSDDAAKKGRELMSFHGFLK